MLFTCSIEINADMETITEAFLNPDNLKHYQDGFKSKSLISGSAGHKGAKSKLIYEKLDHIETIIKNDLPDEFIGLYEHKHMTNTMKVGFKTTENNKTLYTTEIEYTKFNGFLIKVMANLFPGMFKKQVQKWLNQFRNFVESKTD